MLLVMGISFSLSTIIISTNIWCVTILRYFLRYFLGILYGNQCYLSLCCNTKLFNIFLIDGVGNTQLTSNLLGVG